MATKKNTKAVGSVRAFSSVYSHDKVREIDDRIMKAQKKYNARVQKAMANTKDFAITH